MTLPPWRVDVHLPRCGRFDNAPSETNDPAIGVCGQEKVQSIVLALWKAKVRREGVARFHEGVGQRWHAASSAGLGWSSNFV